MNNQLQERLIKGMDEIASWIESSKEFAIEHAPEVAQEILTRGLIAGWTHIIVSVLFFAAGIILFRIGSTVITHRDYGDTKYKSSRFEGGQWLALIAGNAIGLAIFGIGLYRIATIIITPKLYLLEHIRRYL